MKVLGVSGSPRPGGNTDILVKLALSVLDEEGIQTEFLSLADRPIKPLGREAMGQQTPPWTAMA